MLALGLEDHAKILLLEDALARRIAHAARLQVWGALTVLLEAKKRGLTGTIAPHLQHLEESGMWISGRLRERVLTLDGEPGGSHEADTS